MKFATLAIIGYAAAEDMCCTLCDGPGISKYYSIDPNAGHCGESCIPDSKFWLYHIFEKWLTKAENGNTSFPCKEHNFTEYWQTETHGVPGLLSVAVDFYNKPGAVPTETKDYTIKGMIKKEIHNKKHELREAAKGVLEKGIEEIAKYEKKAGFGEDTNQCDPLTEAQCHANSACSWCTSFAVRNKCNTVADAKALPSSIFICDNLGAEMII